MTGRSLEFSFWKKNQSFAQSLSQRKWGRKFLSQIGPRWIEKVLGPFSLYLDLKDEWGVSKAILKHRHYDKEFCDYVKTRVRPGTVALDIGGNIGYWSCFLIKNCHCSKVYAFEPEPKNIDLFKKNMELNKITAEVELFPVAVSDSPGSLELYLSHNNAGDHQLYATTESRKAVTVPVRTIDSLVGDKKIDFIKIDVQGYEPYVFRGMLELLKQNPDVLILSEFWPHGIENAKQDPKELLRFIKDLGFSFYTIEPNGKKSSSLTIEQVFSRIPHQHHVDLIIESAQKKTS